MGNTESQFHPTPKLSKPPINSKEPPKESPIPSYRFLQKTYHPLFSDLIITENLKTNQQLAIVEGLSSNLEEHKTKTQKINFMEKLKHPHLLEVSYIASTEKEMFSDCFKLSQMFEYHSLDLHSDFKLKAIKGECFYTEEEALLFLKQMISALAFLQLKGIVHGGVNGYTIFIDQSKKTLHYKILPPIGLKGFENYRQVTNLGPLAKGMYLSPEQLANIKEKGISAPMINGHKSDVFALGCIVLGMIRHVESDGLFDYIKFENETKGLNLILNGLKDSTQTPFLLNMIKWMIEPDEKKRCDFLELETLLRKAMASKTKKTNAYNKENEQSVIHPSHPTINVPLSSKEINDEHIEEDELTNPGHRTKLPSISLFQETEKSFQNIHLIESQIKTSQILSKENKQTPLPIQEIKGMSFINPQVLQILCDFQNQRKSIEVPNIVDKIQDKKEVKGTYSDGSHYEGQQLNNMKHGKGKYTYPNGNIYEGEWKNDKIDGFGTLLYSNKCLAYYGNWKANKFHGRGSLYNKLPGGLKNFDGKDFNKIGNGWNKYEGNLVEDSKEGLGELSLMNGGSYIGEFHGDFIHGKGVYRNDKNEEMKGEWINGIFQEEIEFSEGLEKDVELCLSILSQKNI